jgi:benzoyl-CoA-dihydrodiol lyase
MTGVEDDGNAGGQKTPDIPESYRYGLALAADYIILTDDGSASVALPEVPLLAVLPGTGGLTRSTDKRKVRRRARGRVATGRRGGGELAVR